MPVMNCSAPHSNEPCRALSQLPALCFSLLVNPYFESTFANTAKHRVPGEGSAPRGTTSPGHLEPDFPCCAVPASFSIPSAAPASGCLLNPGSPGVRIAARCSCFGMARGHGRAGRLLLRGETCRAGSGVVPTRSRDPEWYPGSPVILRAAFKFKW